MDAIVVDTKQTAVECISYLRENRIGVLTFLPLDNLQTPTPESTERLRHKISGDDRFQMAVDVISCRDAAFRPAVLYAVGNAVVCNDLQSAREICFGGDGAGGRGGRASRHQSQQQQNDQPRIKGVTLGGAVISKAGTMTGGVTSEESNKAGRWNAQEIEKLKEQKEKLEAERADLDEAGGFGLGRGGRRGAGGRSSKIDELRNKLGSLKNRDQYSKSDLEYTKKTLKEKETLLKSTEKNVAKLEKAVAAAEKQFEQAQAAVKKAREDVEAAKDVHLAPFREATGLHDLNAYEEAVGKSRDEYNEKKRTIVEHITQLEQQKEYESGRDLQKPIARIEKRIKERQTALEKAESNRESLEGQINQAKEKLSEAEELVKEAADKEKQLEGQVQEAQKKYQEIQSECTRISKKATAVDAELERLRGKLHEALQKARVEEVHLPRVGDKKRRKGRRGRRSRAEDEDDEDEDDSDDEDEEVDEEEEEPAASMSQLSSSNADTQPLTQDSRSKTHFSQADNPIVVRDQHVASKVDFSILRDDLKQRLSDREEKKLRYDFEEKLVKIQDQIDSITPNMKVRELV